VAADGKIEILAELKDKASGALGELQNKVSGIGSLLKVGMAAGAVSVVGLGVAIFKVGQDFEEAYNNIRKQTGATGDSLAGLKDDFKAVFSSIPVSMDAAAYAVGSFSQKTGAAGDVVRELSIKTLEAARLMGVDSKALVDSFAYSLTEFHEPAASAGGLMENLFAAAQKSGVGIDTLSSQVQSFAPVLKDAGYGMQDTIALVGSLGAAGLDAGSIMPGLGKGLKTLAKEGVTDLAGALKLTIEKMKAAKTDGEALAIGNALFGKSAIAVANAARSGALDIGSFQQALLDANNPIENTAKDTETLGEKFEILKNKVIVAVEPLATQMVGTLTDLATLVIDKGIPALQQLADIFGLVLSGDVDTANAKIADMSPTMQTLAGIVASVAVAFRDDLIPAAKDLASFVEDHVLPNFVTGLGVLRDFYDLAVKPLFEFIFSHKEAMILAIAAIGVAILVAFGPEALAIAALVGLITLLGLVKNNWSDIQDTVSGSVDSIIEKIRGIAIIGQIFDTTWTAIRIIVTTQIEIIKTYIQIWLDGIRGIIRIFKDLFHGDFAAVWDDIKTLFSTELDHVQHIFETAFSAILDLVGNAITGWVGVVSDAAPLFLAAAVALLKGMRDGLDAGWHLVADFVSRVPGEILSILGDLGGLLVDAGSGAIRGLLDGANAMFWGALGFADYLRGVPGAITSVLGDLGGLLVDAGVKVLTGLIDGAKSKLDDVKGFFTGVASDIVDWKGPPARDATLLFDNGRLIVQSLIDGGMSRLDAVKAAMQKLATAIADALDPKQRDYLTAAYEHLKEKLAEMISGAATAAKSSVGDAFGPNGIISTAVKSSVGTAWAEGGPVDTITRSGVLSYVQRMMHALADTIKTGSEESKFETVHAAMQILDQLHTLADGGGREGKALMTALDRAIADGTPEALARVQAIIDAIMQKVAAANAAVAGAGSGGAGAHPGQHQDPGSGQWVDDSGYSIDPGNAPRVVWGDEQVQNDPILWGSVANRSALVAAVEALGIVSSSIQLMTMPRGTLVGDLNRARATGIDVLGQFSTVPGMADIAYLRQNGLSFLRGGTVPGPLGASRIIEAHGGETVFPAGSAADRSLSITFNHYGTLMGNEREAEEFVTMFGERLRRRWQMQR
jgi:TP901 family phage tail tape measure protein